MQLPANLAIGANAFTSGAANVAGAMVVVVAAPGAGLRLRVWAGMVGIYGTAQAPLRTTYEVYGGAGATNLATLSRQDFAGGEFLIPGGLLIGTNLEVYARITSSTGATVGFVHVYTTTESA